MYILFTIRVPRAKSKNNQKGVNFAFYNICLIAFKFNSPIVNNVNNILLS